MTPIDADPPEHVSDEVMAELEDSSDGELRTIIHYAQQLLHEHPPLTDAIESREGEELVRIEDYGAYTVVIVERPGETGEARGPFAYSVRWDPNVQEDGGRYRWQYLGKVYGEHGGD